MTAAEQALSRQRHVSPLDVLTGMGWVPPGSVTDWRQGRVPHLEAVAAVTAHRLADALEVFHRWVESRGLRPSEVDYPAATRDRRPLRFTATGDPALELTYRTHWMPADLPERQRERLTARQSKPPDLVVVQALTAFTCVGCGATDAELLMMEDAGPACLTCTDLDHLVFLPAGDATLTRRAKQASQLSAVLVGFNRPRKRSERLGLLVEEPAIEQAEQQCLSDEEARTRRANGTGSAGRSRTRGSSRSWPTRSAGCPPAARRLAQRRSAGTPAPAAAAR